MHFFHVADVHLGAEPDSGYAWGEKRGREIWESFQRLVNAAEEEQVDLLLIAGDLFHRQPLLRELREVDYLFSKLTHTKVVLIAGNHDCRQRGSFYEGFSWCRQVVFLGEENCRRVVFPQFGTAVYGLSYHKKEIREPLYDALEPKRDGLFSILLAHGGDEKHIPIDKRKLSASGFDYIALGHIHKPQILERDRMAYAGALEPIDRNDLGIHGFFEGSFEGGEVRLHFRPWAVRTYRRIELEVQEHTTELSLAEEVSDRICKEGRENIYRLHLRGFRDPETVICAEHFMDLGNILEFVDDTEPAYDFERLMQEHEGDVLGGFIRKLYRPGMDEIQKKALMYGIQAILEVSGR